MDPEILNMHNQNMQYLRELLENSSDLEFVDEGLQAYEAYVTGNNPDFDLSALHQQLLEEPGVDGLPNPVGEFNDLLARQSMREIRDAMDHDPVTGAEADEHTVPDRDTIRQLIENNPDVLAGCIEQMKEAGVVHPHTPDESAAQSPMVQACVVASTTDIQR